MIRPLTLVCMLMAGASGLYLYQSKHQAQMLDREIEKTIKQTDAARERINMLRADWALLNEPDRLSELARAHTTLRPLLPTQFVAMGDLASKLPAPVAPSAAPAPPDVDVEDPAPPQAGGPAIAQAVPLRPATARMVASAPAAAPTPPTAAEPRPTPDPKLEPKLALARHATPHPAPVQFAAGSAPLPPPRPILAPVVPVSVSSAAVAPGTIGESVLRAMRARTAYASAPEPVSARAPEPAYARGPAPTYAPAYAPSAQPAYAAAPAASLLGAAHGGSLPPPVPYAAR